MEEVNEASSETWGVLSKWLQPVFLDEGGRLHDICSGALKASPEGPLCICH